MRRLLKSAALLVLLLVAIAAIALLVRYQRVNEPFRAYAGTEQFVDIPSGAGTRAIGEKLVSAGVVSDHLTYRLALWSSADARRLKAGEYRFDRAMTPLEVIGKIARGEVYVVNVTFPEGHTIAEMSKVFEEYGFGPASTFVHASRDASIVRALDPTAATLEGYLFPDTYALSRHTDATQLVHAMFNRFEHVWTPELQADANERGLTLHQVMTLASIVEKETGRAEERPIVAAVYENRLRIGMALQCDPTVIYALARAGKYNGNLRRDDLAFDSPYNTYRYPGLPPGPIASPGRASIEAAVHPADVDFLYFVSRNDGTHVFARTLAEHNANVQKYQVQYFRDKRAAEAGEAGKAGKTGKRRSGKSGRSGR